MSGIGCSHQRRVSRSYEDRMNRNQEILMHSEVTFMFPRPSCTRKRCSSTTHQAVQPHHPMQCFMNENPQRTPMQRLPIIFCDFHPIKEVLPNIHPFIDGRSPSHSSSRIWVKTSLTTSATTTIVRTWLTSILRSSGRIRRRSTLWSSLRRG